MLRRRLVLLVALALLTVLAMTPGATAAEVPDLVPCPLPGVCLF